MYIRKHEYKKNSKWNTGFFKNLFHLYYNEQRKFFLFSKFTYNAQMHSNVFFIKAYFSKFMNAIFALL